MVDYDTAIVTATKPDYILQQAFAQMTGTAISVRCIQKLMKTHTNGTILDAIKRMQGKKVRAPMAYLFGICKNLSQEKQTVAKQKMNLATAVAVLAGEESRENRPTIERPF